MRFVFAHNNINVRSLDKSLAFYRQALQLTEVRRFNAPDGSFILAFLGDGQTSHQLELTWLKDHNDPYNLGDNEFHLAFKVDDFPAAYNHHKKMDCICYENKSMGIYFIKDPDDYWIEIIPQKR
ncbi:MAG TPA: VOC family protein [Smithellaceae bacterium]|nr:VOC family protein [Smithellaceae bacterium]